MKRYVFVALAFTALSCSDVIEPPPQKPRSEVLSVSISPADTTVDIVHGVIQFAVEVKVVGRASAAVSCQATAGELNAATFQYNPPSKPGTYRVTCVSVADTTKSAFATVRVVKKDLIAFWRRIYSDPEHWREYIFVMNSDGTEQRQITFNTWQDLTPDWSPDGMKIAFYRSHYNSHQSVYTVLADGSGLRRITHDEFGAQDPAWSPDGRSFAFRYYELGSGPVEIGIGTIDTSGGTFQKLTAIICSGGCSPDGYADWSPDGERIAFTSWRDGNAEIYVMNKDGSNQERLTNNPSSDGGPKWSPDGKWIAFSSQRSGKPQIYIMGVNESSLLQVTHDPVGASDQSWSPDGTRIAYTGGCCEPATMDIWIINVDGTGAVNVTNSPTTPEGYPSWRQ